MYFKLFSTTNELFWETHSEVNSTASPTHSPPAFNNSWPSALLVSPTHTYTFSSCIFLQQFIMNIFRHTTTLKESCSEHSYPHHLVPAINNLLYLLHHTSVSLPTFFTHFFSLAEILVSRPGIEPGSPALWVWSLNHWTTREVPYTFLRNCRFQYLSPWVLQ